MINVDTKFGSIISELSHPELPKAPIPAEQLTLS